VPLPDGCPLDPTEYASAWPAIGGGGSVTRGHGDPLMNAYELVKCGCEVCLARLGEIDPDELERAHERIAAAAPKRVDVGPAREHLRRLLAVGRSMTSIAAEAGVDKTTLVRAMRPDVKRLHVRTAEAVLAVGA
jgi:DNA-binding phage protein